MIRITSPLRFITFAIFMLACIVFIVGVFVLWRSRTVNISGEIEIEPGQSARSVWNMMADEGFSTFVFPWRYYGRDHELEKIQAGVYEIERGEHVSDVIARFVAGDMNLQYSMVTYPEGFTLTQIAERTALRGIGTKEEFIEAAKPELYANEFTFLADIPEDRTLEGYLFPDTYRISADDTPEDVIRRMLANFSQRFSSELRQEVEEAGRTIDEVVIMASIIEREVISDDDMAMVADILWRRLDENIGLWADATIRYALDKWTGPLTREDLNIDSLYNSRRYRDLPPGPISNPGMQAILATVRPVESEYYYYLSASSGETIFAVTNDEHNVNKVRYLQGD